jgi:hypothetical protein
MQLVRNARDPGLARLSRTPGIIALAHDLQKIVSALKPLLSRRR